MFWYEGYIQKHFSKCHTATMCSAFSFQGQYPVSSRLLTGIKISPFIIFNPSQTSEETPAIPPSINYADSASTVTIRKTTENLRFSGLLCTAAPAPGLHSYVNRVTQRAPGLHAHCSPFKHAQGL